MAGIAAMGIMVAPFLVRELDSKGVSAWDAPSSSEVLSASIENEGIATDFSGQQFRDTIITYNVAEGDTVSTIADKFNVSTETILWQNNLKPKDSIKIG